MAQPLIQPNPAPSVMANLKDNSPCVACNAGGGTFCFCKRSRTPRHTRPNVS
ncbi:Uncharacterised protein [Ralstonia pickettii]|jgi:hypothetical protein|uniref:Uncharacterized protein n=4 Tax=Ralstonia TaxID=48736 RepID=A0ABM9JNV1_9RALS|nr:hypothetical protein HMPREF0989_02845 [Ralstonia sp. 5_2_56FAA]ENZ75980.1 hypothetical protein OR214_04098 [Ralstonia pickettii OR214]KFL24090.1 hypothetical protein DP23_3249 [Ralstonia pickettii]MDH6645002.1 2-phospho-L-lactate guanylyltransferase (CobY/MobA/RfbA family) [Ralstonia sp. GP73]CAJ0716883.1 hypothetical protein LMG7143_03871 [Ralstonia sp. LMG 18095]SCW82359.1 hypothetical protein SAMN02799637_02759 [Ralstonia sp. UNCCL144]